MRKKTAGRRRSLNQQLTLSPAFVPEQALAGVHPAVPAQLYADLKFLVGDLSIATLAGIELAVRSHPVGVTPRDKKTGRYYVVTGLRTWQIYQVGVACALVKPGRLPVLVHPEAVSDDAIAQLAIADAFQAAQMYSLSLDHGYTQLVAMQKLISDEAWRQLCGDRPRLPERPVKTSRPSSAPLTPTTEKRGRGRPRTRPPVATDAPKRPRGRPRKTPAVPDKGSDYGKPE
jgi:hypothetical protein